MPTTVQTHIPPPAHLPIHPSVWFINNGYSGCTATSPLPGTPECAPDVQSPAFPVWLVCGDCAAVRCGARHSFMFFVFGSRFFVYSLHHLHHRALRHGFLAHLHVLHHVLHHFLLHLCLSRIHGDPLLHHVGDNGGHQAHLLVLRRAVHPGELLGEFSVLSLHVFLHFLFLFHHFLAAFHHFGLRHHLPLRRLGGSRLDWRRDCRASAWAMTTASRKRSDGQGQGQRKDGTDEE